VTPNKAVVIRLASLLPRGSAERRTLLKYAADKDSNKEEEVPTELSDAERKKGLDQGLSLN